MLALLRGGAPRRAARFHSAWAQGAEDAGAASALSPLPARQAAPSPRFRWGTAIRYRACTCPPSPPHVSDVCEGSTGPAGEPGGARAPPVPLHLSDVRALHGLGWPPVGPVGPGWRRAWRRGGPGRSAEESPAEGPLEAPHQRRARDTATDSAAPLLPGSLWAVR
jgi:hypothetical protein